MAGSFVLFDLSQRRWWLLIVAIIILAVGGFWLWSGDRTVSDPVAGVEDEPPQVEMGSVIRAIELYNQGDLELAADEFTRSFGAEIVEYPGAAAVVVDLLVSLSRTEDLESVVTEAIASPVFNLENHINGLEQMVNRLYVNNDLMRSSLVEEKLRTMINELVTIESDDPLLRLYQVRLWAGYLANFPQWDMVAWFAHSILVMPEADYSPELWAEIHCHYAQALLEMWDSRDPATARMALDSAKEMGPGNGWVWYLSGLLNYELGKTDVARQELAQAHELLPMVEEIAVAAEMSRVDIRKGHLTLAKEIEGTWYDLCPDGQLLAVVDRGKMTIYDLISGESHAVKRDSVMDIGYIVWSPDGSQIAYLTADKVAGEGAAFSRIAVYDLSTETESEIVGAGVFTVVEGVTWLPDGRLTVWGDPAVGRGPGLYVISLDGKVTFLTAKDMVWCEDGVDWGYCPQNSLWAVLRMDEQPPKTNARIWFMNDQGEQWLAVDYEDRLVWNPGSISWSTRGELVAHWAQDSWAVTPIKIVVVTADGELNHITWGRSMDSGPVWSPTGDRLAYFTRPIGDDDWYLVVTDRARTWEVRFAGNWRWWTVPAWQGDFIVAGTAPRQIGVFRLNIDLE